MFSHKFHLKKYNNNCKVCHDAIFSLKNKRRYTMAEMEKTKSCGACHSGIKAFSVASEKDCSRCHTGKPRDVSYAVKGLGTTVFSHAVHIAKTGGACKSCHTGKAISKEYGVTMAEMEKGRTCGSCHNGKRAFSVSTNCERCHVGMEPGKIKFKTMAGEATFSHEFHLQNYKCADCHTKIFPMKSGALKASMGEMEDGKSCGACHNSGKDGFSVQDYCGKCHKM
ncbi:MAG: cytochrome c3 family protein [Deltaproteobacteria bacterium]|nr:cytochrome c3 family protein [Deltaproteobacteria bacterium]